MATRQPRQTKTAAQRAQQALDVETRKHARLIKKIDQLRTETNVLETERDAVALRREYLSKHPDLTNTPPTTTTK